MLSNAPCLLTRKELSIQTDPEHIPQGKVLTAAKGSEVMLDILLTSCSLFKHLYSDGPCHVQRSIKRFQPVEGRLGLKQELLPLIEVAASEWKLVCWQ